MDPQDHELLARPPRKHAVYQVIRVIDGDTFVAIVDLGVDDLYKKVTCRLARIQADELSTPIGQAARSHLVQCMTGAMDVHSYGVEKYRRWLVELVARDSELNVNDDMVHSGHARHVERSVASAPPEGAGEP